MQENDDLRIERIINQLKLEILEKEKIINELEKELNNTGEEDIDD